MRVVWNRDEMTRIFASTVLQRFRRHLTRTTGNANRFINEVGLLGSVRQRFYPLYRRRPVRPRREVAVGANCTRALTDGLEALTTL